MQIAVVGATGAVGQEMCSILAQRQVPADGLRLLASARSAGPRVQYAGTDLTVQELTADALAGVDFALFSAGAETTRAFAKPAAANGTVVIDNSSAFRMDADVPLVIPEVNPQDAHEHHGLIANPNCSTIIMAVAVWPLHRINPVRRIIVSTYQAVSGAGAAAMQELRVQTRRVLDGQPVEPKVLPHQSAFNVFSHDSPIDESGDNTEERKMVNETHKMFHDDTIRITATCVRVPVLRAHSESINLTFDQPIRAQEVRDILEAAPGVRVVDDRGGNCFPMSIDAAGQDEVLVGRIRQDRSDPSGCGMALFVCGDQLRKGAALNAIQILDLLTS
ncbi:MAG: aspartate-semialdehyde dehydrogenase [Planctomycetota bacterium]|nr:aspartate-semialdehyde dehydrogenase [Planctomycetota bacterium]